MLTGESPVEVIAKKPCSQPPSVVEILGLKEVMNILNEMGLKKLSSNLLYMFNIMVICGKIQVVISTIFFGKEGKIEVLIMEGEAL